MDFGALTYEQKTLFASVRALVGANPTYTDLYYNGVAAGSEFLTYNAKKLYICFGFWANMIAAAWSAAPYVEVYNEANVLSSVLVNVSALFQTTAAQVYYSNNCIDKTNFYFGRILHNQIVYFKFNGIKVTWP